MVLVVEEKEERTEIKVVLDGVVSHQPIKIAVVVLVVLVDGDLVAVGVEEVVLIGKNVTGGVTVGEQLPDGQAIEHVITNTPFLEELLDLAELVVLVEGMVTLLLAVLLAL